MSYETIKHTHSPMAAVSQYIPVTQNIMQREDTSRQARLLILSELRMNLAVFPTMVDLVEESNQWYYSLATSIKPINMEAKALMAARFHQDIGEALWYLHNNFADTLTAAEEDFVRGVTQWNARLGEELHVFEVYTGRGLDTARIF